MRKKLVVILSLITFHCNSQTLKTIENFESSYQNCLDTGRGMKNCTLIYYAKSDSLLNVAYNNLKKRLNDNEKLKLKKEQIIWLNRRDQYFKKAYLEAKEENAGDINGNDFTMYFYDKKIIFLLPRIKELINRNRKK